MSSTEKQRLDMLLVERELACSRDRAQRLIRAGQVLVDEERIDKPGTRVKADSHIRLLVSDHPYVSRGGLKLAGALEEFGVDPAGKVWLDVGASTGGFTDCLLQHGAERVICVDVGYGQLSEKLRQDKRVTVIDRTNARYLKPEMLPEVPMGAVMDVSFISLTMVLPAVNECLAEGSECVALLKPQFEAGRGQVGKGGIVKDPAVHEALIEKMRNYCGANGWEFRGVTDSPIPGATGNREFLIYLKKL